MLEYIDGAILEAIEKARTLKTKIPGAANLFPDFEALVVKAETEIDSLIGYLMHIYESTDYQNPDNLRQKILQYQRIVGSLSILENVVIAAIARSHKDDEYVNRLVRAICREINYPLQKPIASCLSQKYYHIYPDYGLLCIPLLEADFLLHIADIYHELVHPLIELDNPKLERFKQELGSFNVIVKQFFGKEIERVERNSSRKDFIDMLHLWSDCWIEKWSVEFFCDLFGLYTLGPAYAWSNYHLCVKISTDVFETPLFAVTSHPPDDARMQVLFHALELMGYGVERQKIGLKWNEYINIMQFKKHAEYAYAVPDTLLEQIAVSAFEATKTISCHIATEGEQGAISKMLNDAWLEFWKEPVAFPEWERKTVKKFKSSLVAQHN
ncbi:hypothetical protein Q0590_24980 [Rhodocytophaga aerolata]|uniref:Uncharacterized protein n=1 Tax=Rhodocytophaga aerolata TaxID=455078 RepID=A0ABT8RBR9_9BACT|nr:hypothetical protein [Rhodocytophaga aerolata]MDO1449555.1 hypothetical protein [Rhodocytophaga aerolata]